jgi:hypothetical protein
LIARQMTTPHSFRAPVRQEPPLARHGPGDAPRNKMDTGNLTIVFDEDEMQKQSVDPPVV